MRCAELITDRDEFVRLGEESYKVFNLGNRLPQQVFRQGFRRYFAFEYSNIFSESFAPFLKDISQSFSDGAVNYMTVEPDPGYYFNSYGFYGLASFEPNNLISDYLKVMSRDSAVDSFKARGGDVGIFWGSSLKWGIFCDRINWELCVMGVAQEFDGASMSFIRKMDLNHVQNYIAAAYHWKPSVAVEFAAELAKNYFLQ